MNNTIASFILGTFFVTTGLFMLGSTSSNAQEEVSATAQKYLMNLSMTQQDAYVLIEECRKTERPNKCVKFGGAIRAQEGGYGTKHPFGMIKQPSRYKGVKERTTAQYAELRVGSFERYRHKNNTASDYLTRSKYCTSGCQHRVGNVTRFIASYETGVIPEDVGPTGTDPSENKYLKAKQQQGRTQKLYEEYGQSKQKELQLWKECVDEGITCKS